MPPTPPARAEDLLVLVDENDRPWGKLEKQLVHELGLLHRAFSVFVFNPAGEMLLQRRAEGKYHSAGLWTNACCSHPRYGEGLDEAVERRLMEEMGLACPAKHAFHFIYRTEFDNGLTEHELDHVYIAVTDRLPVPDPTEADAWAFVSPARVLDDMARHPGRYTFWFRLILDRVLNHAYPRKVA